MAVQLLALSYLCLMLVPTAGPMFRWYVARPVCYGYPGASYTVMYFGQQGLVDAKGFTEAIRQLGDTITRDNLPKTMSKLHGQGGYGCPTSLKDGPDVRALNRSLTISTQSSVTVNSQHGRRTGGQQHA